MVGGKGMQILCRGQRGGDRESVMPGWEGGAYKPEPDTSDSEGVEEASAADGATLVEEEAEEAAWATDISSLVFVFGTWGRGGERREDFWRREPA